MQKLLSKNGSFIVGVLNALKTRGLAIVDFAVCFCSKAQKGGKGYKASCPRVPLQRQAPVCFT